MAREQLTLIDEPVRDQQLNVKLTNVEKARVAEAAAVAGQPVAVWVREVVLAAAKGIRATTSIEVPRQDLDAVHAAIDRLAVLQEEVLRTILEHVDHGSKVDEIAARKRAEAKMAETLRRLGLNRDPA